MNADKRRQLSGEASSERPARSSRWAGKQENEDGEGVSADNDDSEAGDRSNRGMKGQKWKQTGRPRPGAALAMAKRENIAIVEGQGKKIVF